MTKEEQDYLETPWQDCWRQAPQQETYHYRLLIPGEQIKQGDLSAMVAEPSIGFVVRLTDPCLFLRPI
jgi:hypothetical protein